MWWVGTDCSLGRVWRDWTGLDVGNTAFCFQLSDIAPSVGVGFCTLDIILLPLYVLLLLLTSSMLTFFILVLSAMPIICIPPTIIPLLPVVIPLPFVMLYRQLLGLEILLQAF